MRGRRAIAIPCFLIGCFATALLLSTAPRSSGQLATADAKQQVLDLEKVWVEAENNHDATTLRRILDDKFIASFGAGAPLGKEAFLRDETTGEIDPTASQTLSEETVILDQDTAVIVGTDTVRRTTSGTARTAVYRYTVTYIRRQGQWLALAEHLVAVPNKNG